MIEKEVWHSSWICQHMMMFLEEIMKTLGFGTRWIATIMKCVSSVTYSGLINGQARCKFKPSRDIG